MLSLSRATMLRPILALLLLAPLASCATGHGAGPQPLEAAPSRLDERAAPSPAPPPPTAELLASASFAAVGDLLMHGAVKDAAKAWDERDAEGRSLNHEGYDPLFAGVADALRSADLAFANLETPIAPTTNRGSRSFVFDAPPALLPALRSAGIGLVSFANNHVYDQGRAGFVETLGELEAAGLPFIGAGRSCDEASDSRILDVNGIRVAFLAATKVFNQNLNAGVDAPCAFLLDEAVVTRRIREAREGGAELVILSIHWGVEYETAPRRVEVDQAHRLLDAGVDVILGHHPHVLQPVEVYEAQDGRITLVAYSLGNFISNQSRTYSHGVHPDKMGYTRDGLLLRFRAVRKRYPGGEVRIELADLRAEALWTENNALSRQRDPALASQIRVIHTDTALAEARAALQAMSDGDPDAVELQRRIEGLEARRRLVGAIVGEDLLP